MGEENLVICRHLKILLSQPWHLVFFTLKLS